MKIVSLTVLALSILLAAACATSGGKEGTQTNWQACDTDGTCPSGYRCVRDECVPSGDGAAEDGAGGRGSGGNANPDAATSTGGATGAGGLVTGAGGSAVASPCDRNATLTPEQWDACSAPIPGPHAIEAVGCDATPAPQDHVVLPGGACHLSPSYTPQNPVRLCGIEPYCTHHDDCTEGPRGRCVGAHFSMCEYPSLDRSCSTDAECSALVPGANCPTLFNDDIYCYPSGECEPPERRCNLPQTSCDSSADCNAAEGGVCKKLVTNTRCEYPECLEDADCGEAARCACRRCVPATCNGDQDCGDGSTCLLGDGCFSANGYHCTSASDTCQTQGDCLGRPCEYREGHWQCGSECPVP